MRRFLLLVVIVLVGVGAWRLWQTRPGADDVIDYRGEKIKLSKSYRDFDDYKNDPANIHPSETERVQRLVIGAPVSNTFVGRLDLFRAMGEIAFPGYGMGSGVGHASDGSELLAVTIEIPRANKDRFIVFRGDRNRFQLVDDFVHDEISYPFEIREENGTYVYSQNNKELFRRARSLCRSAIVTNCVVQVDSATSSRSIPSSAAAAR
jgi:hypothetical protein